jgi:hypothetical protein
MGPKSEMEKNTPRMATFVRDSGWSSTVCKSKELL